MSCRDCIRCYEKTMVCNKFNKSVARGSGVRAYECQEFEPKMKTRWQTIKKYVEPEDYEEAYFNSIGW